MQAAQRGAAVGKRCPRDTLVRAIGIVEGKRAKVAPEIPTVAEAGIPGFNIPDQWVGVLGPAGLPPSRADLYG